MAEKKTHQSKYWQKNPVCSCKFVLQKGLYNKPKNERLKNQRPKDYETKNTKITTKFTCHVGVMHCTLHTQKL